MNQALTHAEIRNLPIRDLALRLLEQMEHQPNFNSYIQGMKADIPYGQNPPHDLRHLQERTSDAWAWLESHALIGPSIRQPLTGNWQRLTERGLEIKNDPTRVSKMWADEKLGGDLDATLDPSRTNFALGDYETAAFAAMKAVEVAVRNTAGYSNENIGVKLMRKAFKPGAGPLCDESAEPAEQQAMADLFAGAIGAFKNPASHRTVKFEDPVEAAEIIQLADLLIRIVARTRSFEPDSDAS